MAGIWNAGTTTTTVTGWDSRTPIAAAPIGITGGATAIRAGTNEILPPAMGMVTEIMEGALPGKSVRYPNYIPMEATC